MQPDAALDKVVHNDLSGQLPDNNEICRHCMQLLTSKVQRETGFCCAGCQSVFNYINNMGLASYYCLRENEGVTAPVSSGTSDLGYYNDENFQSMFVGTDPESSLQLIDFQVKGMHCAACVWLIEKLSEVLGGVYEARVNLLTSRALIKFDRQAVKVSTIARTLESMGYQVQPVVLNAAPVDNYDRDLALRIGVAAFSAMNVMLLFIGRYQGLFSGMEQKYSALFAWASLVLSLPAFFYSATPFFKSSFTALKRRKLHIDLPISFAIAGGFIASVINVVLGRGEIYFDTVTALIFLLLCGRWFQRRALNRAAIKSDTIYAVAPISASRLDNDGKESVVFSGSISAGDTVLVKEGEVIPCDGFVTEGTGAVNNSVLNGESRAEHVAPGSRVWAGATNLTSLLIVTVDKSLADSRFGRIFNELRTASFTNSKLGRFVDRISGYFVSAIISVALVTFLVFLNDGFWIAWDRVIALLVVSCPCALGIATPVTLSLASASAAKRGIVFRTPEALETLANTRKILFDKTGTLTRGQQSVAKAALLSELYSADWIWGAVAAMEACSRHPLAIALTKYAGSQPRQKVSLQDVTEYPGKGISAKDHLGRELRIGSPSWLQVTGTSFENHYRGDSIYSRVVLTVDSIPVAEFMLSDTLRPESSQVVSEVRSAGIDCGILSGDNEAAVTKVAECTGIAAVASEANASPERKAEIVKSQKSITAFVGDGINDALALKEADVGVAVSGGAEISLRAADIFFTRSDLSLLTDAIRGSRKTVHLVHRHLWVSLCYNLTASVLAVCGLIGPLAAALIMPASSLSVILSSSFSDPFNRRQGA